MGHKANVQGIPDLRSEIAILKKKLADEQQKNSWLVHAWKNLEEHRRYVKTATLWEL